MSNRLERALHALRDETGKNPRSEATLDRVLASRRRAVVSWGKRARLWIPIAAVLVVTTSALARSGAIERIRMAVVGSGQMAERTKIVDTPLAPAASVPVSGPVLPAAPGTSASATAPESAPAPAPAPARVPTHVPTPTLSGHALSPAPSSAPTVSEPTKAPTGPSETDVYARAHKLHFEGGDANAALAAWDDYLTRYPSGRFAPDAHYNRAIDLLKLKRYAEARAALRPFADDAFGGYHGQDARDLLRSIP